MQFLKEIGLDCFNNPTRQIAELIGIRKTLDLVFYLSDKKKKVTFHVPMQAKREHYLANVIGFDALVKLCADLGGIHLTLSTKASILKRCRIKFIRGLLELGIDIKAIAKVVGVKPRELWYYKISTGNCLSD